MVPSKTPDSDTTPPTAASPRKRRIVFPWIWLGLLGALRLAVQVFDPTVDFRTVATTLLIALAIMGLAVWYLFRGRGPIGRRLLIGLSPFLFVAGCTMLYEPQFNGAGGIVGLHRRGNERADQRLSQVESSTEAVGVTDWGPGDYDYPRFLGNGPWAEAVGPQLETNWTANPPEELWRREVGAGWSSFAVYGDYAVTQEQRGDQELVVCYRLLTGEPVWSHGDTVRFDPEDFAGQMGRQGPRATPTIVGERIYAQGAKGLVNCLDAKTGTPIWQVDTTAQYGTKVPVWGKSGSPLYLPAMEEDGPDQVVINVGAPAETAEGKYDASLVALDATTGEELWRSGWRQTSYASPQLLSLHGEQVIAHLTDDQLSAHRTQDGRVLFTYPWAGRSDDRPTCSQPIGLSEDRFLLTKGYGHGASLVQISLDGEAWSAEPLWEPPIRPVLQTKFSNAVVRDGYAYGLNGEMLHCVEIETGEIAWRKKRRPTFGFGQILLAGEYLLVMTEESGEIVLMDASPKKYRELAAFSALSADEVCWNNPVLVGEILLVRNAIEAAAYRLPLASQIEGKPFASR